jgi:hypothetical protein
MQANQKSEMNRCKRVRGERKKGRWARLVISAPHATPAVQAKQQSEDSIGK